MPRVTLRFIAGAVLGLLTTLPLRAGADDVVLDLAGDHKVSRSVGAQDLRITIVNRMPQKRYTVAVETKAIPIEVLPMPTVSSGLASSVCDDLGVLADNVVKAKDERGVKTAADALRGGLDAGKCTDPKTVADAAAVLVQTTSVVQGTYAVGPGSQVVVTVTRDSESWEFTFDGGARGAWVVTYGVAVVGGDDQKYFSLAAANSKFIVTPETSASQLKVIPSVYYTWLDRRFANSQFSPGLTAGLGVKDDAPALFVGGSLLHNSNLQLALGVAISKQARLRGRSSAGQTLGESLTSDQLNEGVFKASLAAVVSFRFGSNPWGDGAKKADAAKTDAAKKDTANADAAKADAAKADAAKKDATKKDEKK